MTSATVRPPEAPRSATGRRPVWALPVVALAVVAVTLGAIWGIRGLLADPVKGTDAAGVTTIEGSFEPYDCGTPCIGYVQAGGRSVTVVLPRTCPAPAREEQIRVLGRLDSTQGKATYNATGCPTAI